jgi:hypothetical protein
VNMNGWHCSKPSSSQNAPRVISSHLLRTTLYTIGDCCGIRHATPPALSRVCRGQRHHCFARWVIYPSQFSLLG